MPLLRLEANVEVEEDQREEIMRRVSEIVSNVTGKPEAYVMVMFRVCDTLMAGKGGPAAFADVRGIGGLHDRVNEKLSERLCSLFEDTLGIPPDRVYLNFTDIQAHNWGWNCSTFAR